MFFSVSGFGNLKGSLTIEANYQPSSAERVDITFARASLVRCPDSTGLVQSLCSLRICSSHSDPGQAACKH